MLRIPSPFSDELESLVHRIIGCGIAVHRALGPGLLESIYSRAIRLELAAARLSFEHEKQIPVRYRDELLCHQRLDLVIANQVIVEIKSVDRLSPVHHAQLLSYMRAAGLRVGLLMNFNVTVLHAGVKRIVL
jgi:GxxExxY protein